MLDAIGDLFVLVTILLVRLPRIEIGHALGNKLFLSGLAKQEAQGYNDLRDDARTAVGFQSAAFDGTGITTYFMRINSTG